MAGRVSTFLSGRPFRTHAVVVCGALGAALVAIGASAAGVSTPFDGKWLIEATTSGALCPVRSKRLGALIASGRFAKIVGLPSPHAVGFVDSSGAVTIEIKALGVTAHVKGKIVGKTGQGEWSSNSFLCPGGGWRAAALEGSQGPAAPSKPAKPAGLRPASAPVPNPNSSPIY